MSIPNIGSSALNSTSVGLAATGHSIANASATGYSRQVTETASVGAEDTGAGFVGKGSEVANLRRVYSEFLTDQVRAAETTNSQLSTYKDNVDQINNILANPQAAISPVMQDFFAGVQAVASDANDTSARQQMISNGHAMVSRFDAISSRLHDLHLDVNSRIRASVDDINIQSERVATLNKAITSAESKAGKASTDLLDARDKAILALSKQVKVSVVKQDSNYDVYISSGQSLVIGSNAASLFTAPSPADSSSPEVGYKSPAGATSLLDEKLLA
ncbi:MAG: flagellar hook-associated protein FlgK, partial [Sphingobacteriales bacterium]